MKAQGKFGTIKRRVLEFKSVESLEMKTPGFAEPTLEWEGTITGTLKIGADTYVGDKCKVRFERKIGDGTIETINKGTEVVTIRVSGPLREVK